MGTPHEPDNAGLICGILVGEEALLPAVHAELAHAIGPLARVSAIWPFTASQYYLDELGGDVRRQFVSFSQPFSPDRLAALKLATNTLEIALARRMGRPASQRPVNLDPGYVTLAALVLATTKPRAHRIYLSQGIYAEVTLNYENSRWRAWPWTYPDYAEDAYHEFLTLVRDDLKSRRAQPVREKPAQFHTPPDDSG